MKFEGISVDSTASATHSQSSNTTNTHTTSASRDGVVRCLPFSLRCYFISRSFIHLFIHYGRPCVCMECRYYFVRETGDRAFSVAAPRALNRLPTELKLLRSTDSFRRDLKACLFHSVYEHQDTDWLCDAPRSFSIRERNTSASVTVIVILSYGERALGGHPMKLTQT